MKNTIFFIVAFLLGSALTASASDPAAFVGTWQSQQSAAVYTITSREGGLEVSAVDSSDGEAFRIEEVRFMEGSLFFTSIMPSTGWTVHHQLVPQGPDRLQIFRSGDSGREGLLYRVSSPKE